MAEDAESASSPSREPAERGTLRVADRVVERVAGRASREVAGTVGQGPAWRRPARRTLPRAHAVVAGGRARIGVEIAATWPVPLSEVAARTRDHVARRVTDLTGTTVLAVDVTVVEVLHPGSASGRTR